MTGTNVLKLGIPKGSLQESTVRLFGKAGYTHRGLRPLLHPQHRRPGDRVPDVPRPGDGPLRGARRAGRGPHGQGLDRGERRRRGRGGGPGLQQGHHAPYRWVVAVPEDSAIHTVKDLEGKRIATELVEATRRYLAQHGVHAEVEYSWGATEIKAPQPGGRHRRGHRDRLLAARQPPAHRGHGGRVDHQAHRQQGRLGRPLEARQDRAPGHAAQGRAGGRGQGGAQDERAPRPPERGAWPSFPPCTRPPSPTRPTPIGWRSR